MKKIVFIIIIIFVLAIAGLIIYRVKDSKKLENVTGPLYQINDPANLISIGLPSKWLIEFEQAGGSKISGIKAESIDFKSYQKGAAINLVISANESNQAQSDIISEQEILVSGEKARYRILKGANLAQGQLLEASFKHNDNNYLLSLAYNPQTYSRGQEVFTSVLKSIVFLDSPEGIVSLLKLNSNAIYIADQLETTDEFNNNNIYATALVISRPGYVAVYDSTGELVGTSRLIKEGSYTQVRVILNKMYAHNDRLIAKLHSDNGDGVFNLVQDFIIKNKDGQEIKTDFQIQSVKEIK